MIELRWRAVPFLVPLGILALLPAVAIWVAALVGSVGLASPLDALPKPATAATPFERLALLAIFSIVTLGGPLAAAVLGAFAAVDAELRIERWEISARVRLPAPPWTGSRLPALVLLAVGAVLFLAMAGHLTADCVLGGDCPAPS
jgi:hypothetical protein